MATFVSAEEFATGALEEKKKTEVLTWGELEKNIIHLVLKAEKINTKYGDSYILTIKDIEDNQIRVWAPKSLSTKILTERPPRHSTYILSLGTELKDTENGQQKQYK